MQLLKIVKKNKSYFKPQRCRNDGIPNWYFVFTEMALLPYYSLRKFKLFVIETSKSSLNNILRSSMGCNDEHSIFFL